MSNIVFDDDMGRIQRALAQTHDLVVVSLRNQKSVSWWTSNHSARGLSFVCGHIQAKSVNNGVRFL
jgi:hypothetical protein